MAIGFGYRLLGEQSFIGGYIYPTCFYAALCNFKETFWEVNTGFEYAKQDYQVTVNTCWAASDQTPYFYNYRDKLCGGSVRISGYPYKHHNALVGSQLVDWMCCYQSV